MSTVLSPNLKLKIDSGLTASAKYNLYKIDTIGGSILVDSSGDVNIRSQEDINVLPNNASVGGTGVGGTINLGSSSQYLDALNVYADAVNLTTAGANFLDVGTGGTKYLAIKYNSTLNGAVDTVSNRNLVIDVDGADRNLIMGGNFQFTGGSLTLTLSNNTSLVLPTSGILVTLTGSETLTNKTIDADLNTISNIDNNEIKAAAGIVYSKLTLTNSILNADISSAAAIAYSKLNLAGSIVNADVNASAAIAYSKLNLATSIVNADVSASAAIAYSKLALTGSIVNADIAAGAAISGSKVVPSFGAQTISTSSGLALSNGAGTATLQASASSGTFTLTLPVDDGIANQTLTTDGSGVLSWSSAGSGTVTSVALSAPAEFTVSGSPVTTAGTLTLTKATQVANTIWAGPTTGVDAQPSFRALVAADIPTGIPAANIGNGDVDNTELSYVNGVTSAIQTQLDNKQPLDADLTALAALASTGILARTASDTYALRTITASTGISVSNGNGVAGNPTISATLAPFTTTDLAEGTNLYFTTERAQDSVGGALTDTASVDFTYDDTANTISAVVLPAGVNHNALLNYVANEHVNHTSVQIATAATSGLSGGGDISATRNIVVSPNDATSKATPVAADLVLIGDSAASFGVKKATLSSLASAIGVPSSFTDTWLTATGTSKTVTHNLGSRDVIVQVYDNDNFDTIEVDFVVRTSTNVVTLTSSQAPATSWRVLVLKL